MKSSTEKDEVSRHLANIIDHIRVQKAQKETAALYEKVTSA